MNCFPFGIESNGSVCSSKASPTLFFFLFFTLSRSLVLYLSASHLRERVNYMWFALGHVRNTGPFNSSHAAAARARIRVVGCFRLCVSRGKYIRHEAAYRNKQEGYRNEQTKALKKNLVTQMGILVD